MTVQEVMQELESYGNEQTKKTLMNHGAKEPLFGVKVVDLKKILKKTKKNHELSLALYDTGNTDAMYLAGLMADEKKISRQEIQHWADQAYWYYLSQFTVPWVAAETDFGWEKGLEWIESDQEHLAVAGWSTLASMASIWPDENLDLETYDQLLDRAATEVHTAPNRVRYVMNGFVITVGTYIASLTEKAHSLGNKIGPVHVEMGGTACKVPLAAPYIQKVIDKNRIGKKRKTARC